MLNNFIPVKMSKCVINPSKDLMLSPQPINMIFDLLDVHILQLIEGKILFHTVQEGTSVLTGGGQLYQKLIGMKGYYKKFK